MPPLVNSGPSPFSEKMSVRGPNAVHEDALLSAQILIFDEKSSAAPFKAELNNAGFQSVSVSNDAQILNSTIDENEVELIIVACNKLWNSDVRSAIEKCATDSEICVLANAMEDDTDTKKLAVKIGVDDFLSSPVDSIELIARTRNTLKSKLANRYLAQYSEQLQTDILVDPLTNVSNRRAFDFQLTRKMIEWQRQRAPVALFMIDIDFFKKTNDTYGHQAGDAVLVQVAAIIKETMREMDLVSRFGGEEFAVILPIRRANESTQSAERIRQAVEEATFRIEGQKLKATVSIGVAEVMKGDDQELILKRADTALYESKQNGRNLVTFHDGAKCIAVSRAGSVPVAPKEVGISWTVDDAMFNLGTRHILIVDDSKTVTRVIRSYLDKGGFQNVLCENDPHSIEHYFNSAIPDLLILDIEMPNVDGLSILQQIRSDERLDGMPVIMISSHTDHEIKGKALDLGCNDFLHKPVIRSELLARVSNTLLANAHSKFMAGYAVKLDKEVKLRTSELVASRREAIQCLAKAAEINDDETGLHVIRVGKYAALIAEELGFTETQVVEIEHAAQLHDVGKINIPKSILKKRERLTQEEFDIVKDHCNKGGSIIRDDINESNDQSDKCTFLLNNCNSSVMRMAALVAESHHEKWDGTGYPHGIKGTNIPMEGRIVAVCDVFDAVSNPNAYRDAFDLERCFEIIEQGKGQHFDPDVVDAFFKRKNEVIQVYRDFSCNHDSVAVY